MLVYALFVSDSAGTQFCVCAEEEKSAASLFVSFLWTYFPRGVHGPVGAPPGILNWRKVLLTLLEESCRGGYRCQWSQCAPLHPKYTELFALRMRKGLIDRVLPP